MFAATFLFYEVNNQLKYKDDLEDIIPWKNPRVMQSIMLLFRELLEILYRTMIAHMEKSKFPFLCSYAWTKKPS